jgi:hypothetical protein
MSHIIRPGDNSPECARSIVGGKGENLLRLYHASQELKTFVVPEFFIVPVGYDHTDMDYLNKAFSELRKPAAVRSSSPLEDGVNASFAGMFKSLLDIRFPDEFRDAYFSVLGSAPHGFVRRYAERMHVDYTTDMAVIVQEQVIDPLLRGTIQLDPEHYLTPRFRIEYVDREGEPDVFEDDIQSLDEEGQKPVHIPRENDRLRYIDYIALGQAALDARRALGLEGMVQVEACFSPDKPIQLVQIRQLPDVPAYGAELDMDIPDGVPFIQSEMCNDVAGELILPAYVTMSQSAFKAMLIETGQSYWLGIGREDDRVKRDDRAERFEQSSTLSHNKDYHAFRNMVAMEHFEYLENILPLYDEAWSRGNRLFDEYVLVCDKLDESISEMAEVTTNKRAIITCHEAIKNSHAMTVARDLGIMCMGVTGDWYDLEPQFFHQVETGDLIHMKSDGKKAVAYIEKKRESDPYMR